MSLHSAIGKQCAGFLIRFHGKPKFGLQMILTTLFILMATAFLAHILTPNQHSAALDNWRSWPSSTIALLSNLMTRQL